MVRFILILSEEFLNCILTIYRLAVSVPPWFPSALDRVLPFHFELELMRGPIYSPAPELYVIYHYISTQSTEFIAGF